MKPLRLLVLQDMLHSPFRQVRAEGLGVDWIPPAVRTLYNDIQVVRIAMHVMLGSILSDRVPNLVLQRGANCMLTRIHVRNLGRF